MSKIFLLRYIFLFIFTDTHNIFYSETNPDIEENMIKYFCEHVSDESKSKLFDTINCFPFANKEKNKSIRKKHGLSNQTINCGSNWKK